MILYSRGSGHYESADGLTLISRDDSFITYCDEPHPVRLRLDLLPDGKAAELVSLQEARRSSRRTKRGWTDYISYLCPGQEQHYYSMWTVMFEGIWTSDVYDTFAQAVEALEDAAEERVRLRRNRQQGEGNG